LLITHRTLNEASDSREMLHEKIIYIDLTHRLIGRERLRLTPGIFVVGQANIDHRGVVIRECNAIVADHGVFELAPHSQLLLSIGGARLAAVKTRQGIPTIVRGTLSAYPQYPSDQNSPIAAFSHSSSAPLTNGESALIEYPESFIWYTGSLDTEVG
jgi:hypothetical protein